MLSLFQLRKNNVELETCSLSKLKKKENNNFQHYNTLSAYEVKDETSINSTYLNFVFYCIIRLKKYLSKNSYRSISKGG